MAFLLGNPPRPDEEESEVDMNDLMQFVDPTTAAERAEAGDRIGAAVAHATMVNANRGILTRTP